MSQDLFSIVSGSGIFPNDQRSPAVSEFGNIPQGRYPIPKKTDQRSRTGEGVVVLNAEDFSINKGLRSQSVTVGVSAIAIPEEPLIYRRALVIHNLTGNNTIYIGGSDVTVNNGLPIVAGEKIAFDILGHQNVQIYAVSDAGNQDVRIMELA